MGGFYRLSKEVQQLENKWDLCVEFDPKAQTQEDIEHELEYFGEAPNPDNFPSQPPLPPLPEDHHVELDPTAQTHEDIEHSGEAPNSYHFSSQPPLPPYPKIIMSSLIQWHEPTRTSNTPVKPLIWTTFPPSLLSCPYLMIIGAMTLSILFPPMMNQ